MWYSPWKCSRVMLRIEKSPCSFALCCQLSTGWRLYLEPLCVSILSSWPGCPPPHPLTFLQSSLQGLCLQFPHLSPSLPVVTHHLLQLPVKILVAFQGPAHLMNLLEALRWIIVAPVPTVVTPPVVTLTIISLLKDSEGPVRAGTQEGHQTSQLGPRRASSPS